MSHVLSRFASARKTACWAKEAVCDLETTIGRYLQSDLVEVITEYDRGAMEHVEKLRLKRRLPELAEQQATNALIHARHAFDQATYAAYLLTSEVTKLGAKIYYPWATNPDDLGGRLKRSDIDKRIWDIFAKHQPYGRSEKYTGGDDVIRTLASLANNKHSVGLNVSPSIHVGYPSYRGALYKFRVTKIVWDSVKQETELIRWLGDLEVEGNYQVSLQVLLQQSLLSEPMEAVTCLRRFSDRAEHVVQTLEARCLELAG